MEPVTLRTRRLVLAVPARADVDAVFAACQSADIQRYTTVPSPYLREHAESFVTRAPEEWAEGRNLTWAIREDGALAGIVGLYRIADRVGEIGYWMAPSHRGGGRLHEAASAVVDWGFSATGANLVRIAWRAVVGNVGSARAARALGFRYEGTQRQALVNSLGRDDAWMAGLIRSDDRLPQHWRVLED